MLLLIDNYDSFTCNIAALFNNLGQEVQIKKNDAVTLEEIVHLNPNYIVIGPGPGKPEDAGISTQIIIENGEINTPTLGICLGHQAIGQAFGLNIVRSKYPIHGKQELITHRKKGIFSDIEDDFLAVRYNSLIIENRLVSSSPLEVTAINHIGEIMAIRHKVLPIEGVQFHPESIFSNEGNKIFSNFLNLKKNTKHYT